MVPIYRYQRGLVQGQQIATPPSSRHLHAMILCGQQPGSVLLPRGSFLFLKADYGLSAVLDLEPCLKLQPT